LNDFIQHYTTKEVWQVAIIPLDILALIAQLGGFAVLAGAFLFLKNHITTGKLLVIVGTGQGVITIVATLILELISNGGGYSYVNKDRSAYYRQIQNSLFSCNQCLDLRHPRYCSKIGC
jgi:hypothetical protein